jgi:hypothetical protein
MILSPYVTQGSEEGEQRSLSGIICSKHVPLSLMLLRRKSPGLKKKNKRKKKEESCFAGVTF